MVLNVLLYIHILMYFINIYCKRDFVNLRRRKLYIQSFNSKPADGFWNLETCSCVLLNYIYDKIVLDLIIP